MLRLVVLIAFLALAGRLIQIQGLSGNRYSSLAAGQVTTVQQVQAIRGAIYDRNGEVLAITVPRSTIVADPFIIKGDAPLEASRLAPILHVPAALLLSELTEDSGFVYLAKLVDNQVAEKVREVESPGDKPSRISAESGPRARARLSAARYRRSRRRGTVGPRVPVRVASFRPERNSHRRGVTVGSGSP